jgi:hypothetical protein
VFGKVKGHILRRPHHRRLNVDRVRAYRAKPAGASATPKRQPKRRRGTWTDVIEPVENIVDGMAAPPG